MTVRAANAPLVVFTDLDGTLLNHHDYSWQDAAGALGRLNHLGIPWILNSSKTRAEMVQLRHELGNAHPFVTENGAAVHVPAGYFEPEAPAAVELLGPPRRDMLRTLHALRTEHGFDFLGFADMSLEALRRHTGLDAAAARNAAERDGTEPLLWRDTTRPPEALRTALEAEGLRLVRGGRFFHAMGDIHKGRATQWLIDRYRQHSPGVVSVALGDSPNDLEMLRTVDYSVVIPRASGEPLDPGPLTHLLRAPRPGAAGWGWAMEHLLDQLLEET